MRDENDDISSEDDGNLSDVEEEGSDEDGDDVGSNQVCSSKMLLRFCSCFNCV